MFKTQTIEMGGSRLVVMTERDYAELTKAAGRASLDDRLPAFPKPDKQGNMPALQFARVSIARDIIRQRRALGLSQQELASLAGVRQETISRLETGRHSASKATITKLDRAFKRASKPTRAR